jgi:uncharacterized CHY-type Zn-finger protein
VESSGSRPRVNGVGVDAQTRCVHYSSAVDVIAIRMKCCGDFYACKDCHAALAHHAIEPWPRSEWDRLAVLCGVCGTQLRIEEYLGCANKCPYCAASFNPGCSLHSHFYFEKE